jgi:hypothetical protein
MDPKSTQIFRLNFQIHFNIEIISIIHSSRDFEKAIKD